MSATPEPAMQLPFFVYGTLLPGQPNAHLWAEAVVAQEAGRMENGRLYDLGSFPILVEEGDSPVQGVVLYLAPAAYATTLAQLDELEGFDPAQPDAPGYRRVKREVEVGNGRWQTAWVYVGQGLRLNGQEPIPNGDWLKYTQAKMAQIDAWWQETTSILHLFNRQEPTQPEERD
jgi:gamma-glutamylcyclotransferase (GGCT)/AIG2-like uncharacterized protein YtfP